MGARGLTNPVVQELGSEDIIWARSVPDGSAGGSGFRGHAELCPLVVRRQCGLFLELLGTVLARWGLFTALGLVGGRGHGDICNWPGSPLLEPILGQLGSPRGAIQRQDPAQQGLAQGPPAQRMAPGICM